MVNQEHTRRERTCKICITALSVLYASIVRFDGRRLKFTYRKLGPLHMLPAKLPSLRDLLASEAQKHACSSTFIIIRDCDFTEHLRRHQFYLDNSTTAVTSPADSLATNTTIKEIAPRRTQTQQSWPHHHPPQPHHPHQHP